MVKIATFSGASGSGKTSIVQEILKQWPDTRLIPSVTTRKERPSDVPGEYLHTTKEDFVLRKNKDEFLEYDTPHGDWYGTLRSSFEEALGGKLLSVKAISPKGAQQINHAMPGKAIFFYIIPPSEDVLRERLEKRQEPQDRIEKRLLDCKMWYDEAQKSSVPYVYISNDSNDGDLSPVLREIARHIEEAQIIPLRSEYAQN